MRKIIGIGETVLDIIFQNNQPSAAVPGGSTFNALISLGRAGVKAMLISQTGDDRVGQTICSFAAENGVDTSYVSRYKGTKSPLSLAFLNESNDAEYIFYKDHEHDFLDLSYPDVHENDVILFGSYYALNPVIRDGVKGFLEFAKSRGAILYYDVNFRSSHSNEAVKLMPALLENFELADIVRGSSEDFDNLFHLADADKIYSGEINYYCKNFLCTRGGDGVSLRTPLVKKEYPVRKIKTVSTIGAGDNFNAGLIYSIFAQSISKESLAMLDEAHWDKLIESAMKFSANVCQSLNNYIEKDFVESLNTTF